jgi:hypothetical protein
MTRHDVTELAGLFTGVLGFGLALYGLLLIATWLPFIVGGLSLVACGAVTVVLANRGGA